MISEDLDGSKWFNEVASNGYIKEVMALQSFCIPRNMDCTKQERRKLIEKEKGNIIGN